VYLELAKNSHCYIKKKKKKKKKLAIAARNTLRASPSV
jgi:hypothetical protein